MILKTGVKLQILRQGSLATVVTKERQELVAKKESGSEFIYFATKAIAGDIPNGNGDYFPWDHLLKSYTSFIGRNLFLNHDSGSPLNAIGKVLDAYPVVDAASGEKYIECLAKVDAVAHPELARQISSGILDSCSMGCSVESSQCCVCGLTIYSDQDQKCTHMARGLGKQYTSELDFPEFNVKKGDLIKAYAINRGLNFTELSVVNVPAWDNAKIVQVIAKLKERVANGPEASSTIKDLEDILQMASEQNLEKVAEAPEAAAPVAEAPVIETPKKEDESRESRLTKIFKEKLSALDFLDLQAFIMKKETSKEVKADAAELAAEKTDVANLKKAEDLVTEVLASEKKEVAQMEAAKPEEGVKKEAADEKKCDKCTKEKACAECAKMEKKEEKKAELAPEAPAATIAEVPAPVAEIKTEEIVEAAKTEGRKLKAIFVSKPEFNGSYWVVTDDGKPVLKASLGDIWGEKLAEVRDYASSPIYGEALLQRLREDGVKKVALLTNATIYTEAAGDQWPSSKSVGRDQYSPAGPEGHAKMKKSPEGVDMSGGDTGAASTGPTGGKGDQYPTSKSMGKSQYKPSGNGGGPKAKTEKASSEDTEGKIEVVAAAPADMAEMAPAADMPPAEAPAADMPPMDEKGPAAAMKPVSEMSAEEMLAFMKELVEAMDPSKKTAKPLAAVEKAVEKLDVAMTKEQEAAAKEAAKEAEAAAKEAEKAAEAQAKEDEKAAKAAEKAEKSAPKEDKKEEKADKKEEKAEDKKEDKKDDKADKKENPFAKKDEGMDKTAEAAPVAEAVEAAPVEEAPAEVVAAISERERELESQLAQLKFEKSMRAKTARCQTIVNEMIDKDLIVADESDIQSQIVAGMPLFDARASAYKIAVDKQCRDLLAMEEHTLQAFSQTIGRMKIRTAPAQSSGVLKKAFRLSVDEHNNDDAWLNGVFNQMGSQKGGRE